MAGQPKRRAMLAELLRLARELYGDETPEHSDEAVLTYVADCIESGETIKGIAKRVGVTLYGEALHRSMLAQWLSTTQQQLGRERTLDRARETGAHALVEAGLELVDDAAATPGAVAKAKAQLEGRQNLAQVWNREAFAPPKQLGPAISIQLLHLDALKNVVAVRALPNGEIPDAQYEVVDAESQVT